MAANPQQLPYPITTDLVIGANSRATQQAMMSMPRFVNLEFVSAYVEPLAVPVQETPLCIELVRVVNTRQPSVPLLCGSMCHWAYQPLLGGALIYSIDGLTSDASTLYSFTFRITYKAQV